MGGNITTARRSSIFKVPGGSYYHSPQEMRQLASNAISYQFNQEGVTSREEKVSLPVALHNCFVTEEVTELKVRHLEEKGLPPPMILSKCGTLIFRMTSNDLPEIELRSTKKGLKPVQYVLETMFDSTISQAIMSFLIEPEYETKNEKSVDQVFKKLVSNYISSTGRPPQNILVFLETNGSLSNFSGREISEFLELDKLRKQYGCYVRCQEHLRKQGLENGYQWLREVVENRLNNLSTDATNYSLVGPRCIYE